MLSHYYSHSSLLHPETITFTPQHRGIQCEHGPFSRSLSPFPSSLAASSGVMSYLDNLIPGARPGTAIQDFFSVKLIISALTATRDRRIPDSNAILTLYKSVGSELGDKTIQKLRWINLSVPRRYPSKTYENFRTYLATMDKDISAGSVPS